MNTPKRQPRHIARLNCAKCGRLLNPHARPDRFGFVRQSDRTPCPMHGRGYLYTTPLNEEPRT